MSNYFKEGTVVRVTSEKSNRFDQVGVVRTYDSDGVPYENEGTVVEFDDGQRVFYSNADSLTREETQDVFQKAWNKIIEFICGFTANKYY